MMLSYEQMFETYRVNIPKRIDPESTDVQKTNRSSSSSETPSIDITKKSERSLFLPNLRTDVSVQDLVQISKSYGRILSIHIVRKQTIPPKVDGYINFINPNVGKKMYNDSKSKRIAYMKTGRLVQVEIHLAKLRGIETEIADAIQRQGATRNLYVRGFSDKMTEAELRKVFGPLVDDFESCILNMSKRHAFVNTGSVAGAIRAMQTLNGKPVTSGGQWAINFAKEQVLVRDPMGTKLTGGGTMAVDMATVAKVRDMIPMSRPLTPEQRKADAVGFVTPELMTGLNECGLRPMGLGDRTVFPTTLGPSGRPRIQQGNEQSRGIFLGTLAPQTTIHDLTRLANAFGAVESLKVLPQRMCAFVNFAYPAHACMLYAVAARRGIALWGANVSVGWAKPPPIDLTIAARIQKGASRIVFFGNLSPNVCERTLYALFRYATAAVKDRRLESIVIHRKHHFAFVSTTSIAAGIAMVDRLRGNLVLDGQEVSVDFATEHVRMCPAFKEAPTAAAATPSASAAAATAATTTTATKAPGASVAPARARRRDPRRRQ